MGKGNAYTLVCLLLGSKLKELFVAIFCKIGSMTILSVFKEENFVSFSMTLYRWRKTITTTTTTGKGGKHAKIMMNLSSLVIILPKTLLMSI